MMNRLERIKELKEKRRKALEKIPLRGERGYQGEPGEAGYDGMDGLPGEPGEKGERGFPGIRGSRGLRGFPGEIGKEGSPGQKGIIWRAGWVKGIVYRPDEAVNNYGSAYICLVEHTSTKINEPTVGEAWRLYWAILAERGETGPGGRPGPQGEQGPPGPAGSNAEVYGEIPGGVLNGINLTFTTAFNFVATSTRLYLNGVRQISGDYIESGSNQVTFTMAPISSDVINIDYSKL